MSNKSIPKLRFPEFTDEWERRKLGEITVKIGSGKTPLGGKSAYIDNGIPLIRSQNVNNDRVNFDDVVFIDNATDNSMANSRVYTNDVLLNITGASIGRSAVYKGLEYANVNQHVCIIRPISNYISDFIQLNLVSDNGQKQIESSQAGGGREGLNFQQIGKMQFMFPTKGEQEQIGSFFNHIDNLITLHQRKCNSLKELRDGAIQRILSKELRFKKTDESEFENWVTKELSEIFTERKVSQIITEDAPLLSFTIEQGIINPQDKKTNKRDFLIKDKDTKKFALTEVDDIIYNPANLKYGAIHRNKLMRGVVSPIYAIFYTEQNPAFIEYVVKNPTFIKNSLKYLEGTVIKLMTLKPKDFLKLKVEIPASLEEQKIIADFLMQFDETIDAEQRRIEKWKELKKGLIQQMLI